MAAAKVRTKIKSLKIMDNYILYSSNSRPKYISDILNVLALPKNLEYHFRYKEKYITSSLKHKYSQNSKSLIGSTILLCYRDDSMVIPVRWAKITEINLVTDFYIIKFSVQNYVNLCFDDFYDKQNVCFKSEEFIKTLNPTENDFDIQEGYCGLANPDRDLDTNSNFINWINTVKVLSLNETFKDSFFLNIEPLRNESKEITEYNESTHHFNTKEFHTYNLKITYYSKDFNTQDCKLSISHSSENITITTPKDFNLDSRYDSLKIWFNCVEISENNYTGLTIKTINSNINTNVYLPIFINKSNTVVWYRIITSFIGAALIAAPSLLPDTTNYITKLILASIGALIIAFLTNFKNPFK